MMVLIKNDFCQVNEVDSLIQTFWDDKTYVVFDKFDFSKIDDLITQNDEVLSPFFFLDARVAFLISLLERGNVYCTGLGALGTVAAIMRSGRGWHTEDQEKVASYIEEYFPFNPLQEDNLYTQVVSFNKNELDEKLWNNLAPGGTYIMGSIDRIKLIEKNSADFICELWPVGKATSQGWLFDETSAGPGKMEYVKLKKLR